MTLNGSGLDRNASVLALVPHYRCERWLADCLESLTQQTRPPAGIAVIDDASPRPPLDIVARFPQVTLLQSADNVGPYALIQAVIERTAYDAYLFNDADDWSARDRLDVLLREAERTGAELIGSREVRILCDHADALLVSYPLDVNEALRAQPAAFPLLHGTSLLARDLVQRVGGFATGMRFGGDAEFLRRAVMVARSVNVAAPLYLRRKRAGALTTDPGTGLESPARLAVHAQLTARARANAERIARGEDADLAPLQVAPPVSLRFITGPPLLGWNVPVADAPPAGAAVNGTARATQRGSVPRAEAAPARPRAAQVETPATAPGEGAVAPIFVLGPPRSGAMLLAWSLGQHPSLRLLPDAAWIGGLAESTRDAATSTVAGGLSVDRFLDTVRSAIDALAAQPAARPPHLRWVHATPDNALHIRALRLLYPDARFIHVVRDVDSVVHALVEQATPDGSYFTERSACELWLRTVRACLDAEDALGRDVVLRVNFTDLLADPESVIRRCLRFVEEPFDAACLRPLNGIETAPSARSGALMLPAGVRALSASLMQSESASTHHGEYAVDEGRDVLAPVDRMRALLRTAVPPDAVVLIVSKGDDDLVQLPGRRAWHFPQADDGVYAGHHPADTASIVAHLHELRERGASFLFIPCTALWWLTHYPGLRQYLESQHRLVAYHEDLGVVFALRNEFHTASMRAVLIEAPFEGMQPVAQEVIQ